jgi:hypothetical protein
MKNNSGERVDEEASYLHTPPRRVARWYVHTVGLTLERTQQMPEQTIRETMGLSSRVRRNRRRRCQNDHQTCLRPPDQEAEARRRVVAWNMSPLHPSPFGGRRGAYRPKRSCCCSSRDRGTRRWVREGEGRCRWATPGTARKPRWTAWWKIARDSASGDRIENRGR